MATHTAMAQGSDASLRCSLEQRLGILHYASFSDRLIWHGQTRTRFTDFQVHEITKDGEVVHLSNYHNNARALARDTTQSTPPPASVAKAELQDKPESPTARRDALVDTTNQSSPATKGLLADTTNHSSPLSKTTGQVDQPAGQGIAELDKTALTGLLGQATVDELVALYDKIRVNTKALPKGKGIVRIPPMSDKAQRSQVHEEIRRVFHGKIDTRTDSDGCIQASPLRPSGTGQKWGDQRAKQGPRNSRSNSSYNSGGPRLPFLHFTLYKENKDTMDAINHIAKTLRLPPKAFGIAGTKDRRAVTSQRVSIRGRSPPSMLLVNERIGNVKIGDFKFAQHPIRLNDHDGNEFIIVMKNCFFEGTEGLSFSEKLDAARSTVKTAMSQVAKCGFVNYYGTQRFGTHEIGTQEVGMKILQNDFAGAIDSLLSYNPAFIQESFAQSQNNREDIGRAKACSAFLTDQDPKKALDCLPPRFHVERAVIQHLVKNPTDFPGALMCINRSMRTMYVHAYQSLVWNFVASKRWAEFGAQVIKGDIVLLASGELTSSHGLDHQVGHNSIEGDISDDDGNQNGGSSSIVAHALTEEDVMGGKYSIYDVVLPSPGWDVLYPPNEIGKYYTEFMGRSENGGLDPRDMHRRQRDFSLPGSYRKLMGKLKGVPTATVQPYSDDTDQLVPTDLDKIHERRSKHAAERAQQQQHQTTSAWHHFAQNVERVESEESKARIARQEAEETRDAPSPTRFEDKWIQTGVDNSNKRIKITTHTADVSAEGSLASRPDETAGQPHVHISDHETNGADTAMPTVDETKEAQVKDQNGASLTSRIVSALSTQSTDSDAHDVNNSTPLQPIDSDVKEADVSQSDPTLSGGATRIRTDTNTSSETATAQSSDPSVSVNASSSRPLPVAVTSEGPGNIATTQDIMITSADTPNAQKIAVILQFVLDTSQYATIVVRELQGGLSMKK